MEFAVARGADRSALLSGVSIDQHELADLDARVPLEAVYTLVERAAAATDDARFALDFARTIRLESFDSVGFLMATSATLGDAFERGLACQRIWADGEHYELAVADDVAAIRYWPFGPERVAHRLFAEMVLSDIGLNAGQLCGRALPLVRLRLRQPGPLTLSEYEELFGCPVELRAPVNEVAFAADALAWPLRDANEAMNAFFDRYARQQIDAIPSAPDLGRAVRVLIADRLEQGPPTLDAVARRLGMSGRTLQRRLRRLGTSLHALVDEVRRERAAAFLDTHMAVAEIAYLLGYSDPSAFHRAYKRWTGDTPCAHRHVTLPP